ncbi:hypothetical protein B7494_g1156 [Chlorociboria aeruginascens]|nr:hypothetical protein B7494_g1156 [Chlorociboria aeruginascens]
MPPRLHGTPRSRRSIDLPSTSAFCRAGGGIIRCRALVDGRAMLDWTPQPCGHTLSAGTDFIVIRDCMAANDWRPSANGGKSKQANVTESWLDQRRTPRVEALLA